MSIRMARDRGLLCPQVFCDFCKLRIEDAKGGNFEYRVDEAAAPMEPVFFSHKRCSDSLRASRDPRGMWYCDELWLFPVQLGTSLSVDLKKAEVAANSL